MTDSEIISLILKGNKDIFRLIVEKYQPLIFRTCIGFFHNKEEADDLCQEILINIYENLSKFKGNSSFSTWVYRIAINASLNRVRKAKRASLFQKNNEIIVEDYTDPETIIIRNEHQKWVQRALDKLPEKQRTAFVLKNYDDLTQKEIAVVLDISEGAVESLIQRAKSNLRKNLVKTSKKSSNHP